MTGPLDAIRLEVLWSRLATIADEAATALVDGTTPITNTVLERTGARAGLITTEGFRDILEMGREIRYDVEDLHARLAPVPLGEDAIRKAVRDLVNDGIEAPSAPASRQVMRPSLPAITEFPCAD